eukprot:TRINITY_DN973_c0_g1_i10.p2 TRINITY_DN973_c0_g1~~TRINITY_DN973_c0_g1_i10.p2  ORF type:complete len:185 (-),score=-15.00 TRINITY_DN973_c0_g1_i10:60-614(-)
MQQKIQKNSKKLRIRLKFRQLDRDGQTQTKYITNNPIVTKILILYEQECFLLVKIFTKSTVCNIANSDYQTYKILQYLHNQYIPHNKKPQTGLLTIKITQIIICCTTFRNYSQPTKQYNSILYYLYKITLPQQKSTCGTYFPYRFYQQIHLTMVHVFNEKYFQQYSCNLQKTVNYIQEIIYIYI